MGQSGVDIRMESQVKKVFPFSVECFGEGTLVLTSNGFKPIEQVQKGEKVLTHNSRFRKVREVFSRTVRNTINLQVSTLSEGIMVTNNHEFEYFEGVFRPITEIGYVSRIAYTGNAYDKAVKSLSLNKKSFNSIDANYKQRYCACGCGSLINKFDEKKFKHGHSGSVYNKNNTPNAVKVDTDLMFLFGLYIAEGRVSINYGSVTWTFHEKEINLISEVDRIVYEKFNLNTKHRPAKHSKAYDVIVYSSLVAQFFDNLLNTGSHNKKLGDFIFYSKDLLSILLKGYFLGDGCRSEKYYRAETVSRNLAYDLNFALLRFNVNSTVSFSKNAGLYSIQIKRGCLDRFNLLMDEAPIKSIKNLPKCKVEDNNRFIYDFSNNRIYSKISAKERVEKELTVYNLEVEEDNTYVIEGGISVHNCKAQENWAIHQWIKQSKENQEEGTDWLLFAKRSRQNPVVVMDAERFFELLKKVKNA
jgi:intein/homing endonuclease